MQQKKALVTGGAGFIGKSLVRRLVQDGYHVVIIDNFTTSDRLTDDSNIEVMEADVRNLLFPIPDIDIIFHLASLVGMELCHESSEETYDVIVKGSHNILRMYPHVKKVLFSSSCVYGLDHTGLVDENQVLDFENVKSYDGTAKGYATGKWYMEFATREKHKISDNMIIRPFNVVGADQSPAYGMVIPKFITAASENKPLTVYDDGQQSRCFAHVDDFIDNLMLLINHKDGWDSKTNTYNVGSPTPTKILDLAKLIIEKTNSNSEIILKPYSEKFPGKKDVSVRIPNIDKLEAVIGQQQWRTIDEIVNQLIHLHRNEPHRV